MSLSRTRVTLASGVLLGTLAATAAWAQWFTSGRTTAISQAESISFSVDAVTITGPPLRPGGAGGLRIRLTNHKPFAVRVVMVLADGPVTVDAAHPGCVRTGVSLVSPIYTSWLLAPRQTKEFATSNKVRMTNGSDNGCQGAMFHVPLRATATTA
ncbi:hypothetical protein GCM10010124_00580 [Pilimelia terevasa]|uniref:Uncharacterized protein n=1 Tax=Pilimelia terevasa TaxID=53372 RepID=A0A8J3BCN3_9ACTN|nr:hypothetical protein [Pilimelia terevasa]GGK11815.1 hypothetical protein GCM10010124_00580 [Pilimelia terevasa]